jgi:nicotinate-nucleotide adenylyltransferase
MKEKPVNETIPLGIFGAAFDPPHYGHLIAAEWVAEELRLRQILMIPSNINPLKRLHPPAPATFRWEMIQAALKSHPNFKVSDIEIKRSGISYMIDTLKFLQNDYPPNLYRLYLLLGADIAAEFGLWRDYEKIAQICQLVAFNRPGYDIKKIVSELPAGAISVHIPMMDISSTMLRERIQLGKSIRFLTPSPVCEIIEREKLYRNPI